MPSSSHTSPATLMGLAIVATVATLSSAFFAYRPTSGRQLLVMASSLAILGLLPYWVGRALRGGRARWSVTKWGTVITLLGFAGCWAGIPVGKALTRTRFRAQVTIFDSLVASLNRTPRGLAPVPQSALPPMMRGRPTLLAAEVTDHGGFAVTLFYGGGFPVHHSAFVYFDGVPDSLSRSTRFHWRTATRLAPQWFYVSD